MVCLSSKNWSQPRPLASVSWLISLCRGISAVIQEGRPRLVFCGRRAALSCSRALTKEHSAVTRSSPTHGICSNIRTLRDTACAHRMLGRLFPEAKLEKINVKQTAKRQPRITDGGAGRDVAVQLGLRQKITLWRKQSLSVQILTPPEASLVVGLNQLISPLFLTDVPHRDHLSPDG